MRLNKADLYRYKEFREELGETAAEKAFLRWKALTDLYFLGTEILGWELVKKGTRNVIDPKFHKWLTRVLSKNEDKMVLVPRYHLKTTWVKLRILQKILENPLIRILLGSKTAGLVEKELRSIKQMACNPLLMQIFNIPNPGKDYINWEKSTATELTIYRPQDSPFIPQEPQIYVCGMGGTITGYHFDEAYLDDIIDDKNVANVTQIEKVDDWWGYLKPILGDALLTVTGTPYHYADIYAKIMRRREFGKDVYIRSVKENGKFIYSFLNERRFKKWQSGMTPYQVSCQYFCNPTPVEQKVFPPPQPTYTTLPPDDYKYYITVDPAATTHTWSDESGIAVGTVNKAGILFIPEAFGVKLPPNKLADLIIKYHIKYKPIRIGIEFIPVSPGFVYVQEKSQKLMLFLCFFPVFDYRIESSVFHITLLLKCSFTWITICSISSINQSMVHKFFFFMPKLRIADNRRVKRRYLKKNRADIVDVDLSKFIDYKLTNLLSAILNFGMKKKNLWTIDWFMDEMEQIVIHVKEHFRSKVI